MIVGGHSVLRLESQPVFGSLGVQLNEVSNAPSWVVQLQIGIKVDVGLGLKNSLPEKIHFCATVRNGYLCLKTVFELLLT